MASIIFAGFDDNYPALRQIVWKLCHIGAGFKKGLAPYSCGQKDDVGQAAEGLKSSGSDDGGLNLTVDVFSGLPRRLKGSRRLLLCQGVP